MHSSRVPTHGSYVSTSYSQTFWTQTSASWMGRNPNATGGIFFDLGPWRLTFLVSRFTCILYFTISRRTCGCLRPFLHSFRELRNFYLEKNGWTLPCFTVLLSGHTKIRPHSRHSSVLTVPRGSRRPARSRSLLWVHSDTRRSWPDILSRTPEWLTSDLP